ncbi:hypothetical protein V6N13_070185 [Hibiscus sabdariffa]|uniref:Uncharacterized protein n=1 Tax=Hibiscus sabdariffa TaxID=183260 RepID=A0ABR2NB25_9ROSI
MESLKKLAFALTTMAVVLAATTHPTATAARKQAMPLPIGADINSASINTNDTLADMLDLHVNHAEVGQCIPKKEFCLFSTKLCCSPCNCYGFCVEC